MIQISPNTLGLGSKETEFPHRLLGTQTYGNSLCPREPVGRYMYGTTTCCTTYCCRGTARALVLVRLCSFAPRLTARLFWRRVCRCLLVSGTCTGTYALRSGKVFRSKFLQIVYISHPNRMQITDPNTLGFGSKDPPGPICYR